MITRLYKQVLCYGVWGGDGKKYVIIVLLYHEMVKNMKKGVEVQRVQSVGGVESVEISVLSTLLKNRHKQHIYAIYRLFQKKIKVNDEEGILLYILYTFTLESDKNTKMQYNVTKNDLFIALYHTFQCRVIFLLYTFFTRNLKNMV